MTRSFSQRCYILLKQVPSGKVTTYKDLAHALGTRSYRAVGAAMRNNPHAPHVPCHRVVASDGSLHGYAGGLDKKKDLLRQEGVDVYDDSVDLKRFGYANFNSPTYP